MTKVSRNTYLYQPGIHHHRFNPRTFMFCIITYNILINWQKILSYYKVPYRCVLMDNKIKYHEYHDCLMTYVNNKAFVVQKKKKITRTILLETMFLLKNLLRKFDTSESGFFCHLAESAWYNIALICLWT